MMHCVAHVPAHLRSVTVAVLAASSVLVSAAILPPAFAGTSDAPAAAPAPAPTPSATCAKSDFEAVVEQAAGSLRDLNAKNKPAFQEKLRTLKDKRGWDHAVFLKEAAPFVRDDKISEFDQSTDVLLTAISQLGQEGANAAVPDCALLLELRARMTMLVETQTAKWVYMFGKIDAELWK